MSRISHLHNFLPFFFDAPLEEEAPLSSEEDLQRRTKFFDSERNRKFKDIALGVLRWVAGGAFFLLAWRLITDVNARFHVTDLLIDNIVGLVYSLLVILGIKINNKE